MTITYTWNFDPLETKPSEDDLSDVVKTIHWQLHGYDDETGNTGRIIGAQSLSSPDSDEFVLFEDLTQDVVLQWILSTMIKEDLETVEAVEDSLKEKITQQIEKKNNPPIVNRKAPWSTI
jgi:hypothetical protein